jgi:aryl-alcohol dehydrogenase-like predicted oxidoreductase
MRGDALQSEVTVRLADELNVAPLGVGAWAWGTSRLWGYGKEYDRSDVGAAFRASMAEGVTLVDTAEMYGKVPASMALVATGPWASFGVWVGHSERRTSRRSSRC